MKLFIRGMIAFSMLGISPSLAYAGGQAADQTPKQIQKNLTGVQQVISFLINWLLIIAPALIILSFVWSALLWTLAGSNTKMVQKAQSQFKVTCICLAVIGGFFLIKGVILGFSIGGFEAGSGNSADYGTTN